MGVSHTANQLHWNPFHFTLILLPLQRGTSTTAPQLKESKRKGKSLGGPTEDSGKTHFSVKHYSSCQICSCKFLQVTVLHSWGKKKIQRFFLLLLLLKRFKERYLGFITNRTYPFDTGEALKCPWPWWALTEIPCEWTSAAKHCWFCKITLASHERQVLIWAWEM